MVAVLAIGCKTGGPIVIHDVRIDGYDLVIERCELNRGSCEPMRQRLPVTPIAARSVLPTPDRARIHRRIGMARNALANCAAIDDVHGVVRVELVIDAGGRAIAAELERGTASLTKCVVEAFGPAPFPVSLPETRISFMFFAGVRP